MMRARRSIAVGVAAALALTTTGCANMTKEQMGTVTGAVAGGIIGNMVPRQYRGLAILGGILIGAHIGSKIGASLDEADRNALNKHMALGLTQGKPGQQFAWANPQSGASAAYTTSAAKPAEKTVRVVRTTAMEAPPRLEIDSRMHQAITKVEVRAAPRDNAQVAATLVSGESVKVYGKVVGSPWLVVAKDGRAIGYVPAKSMKPAGTVEPAALVASGAQSGQAPPEGSAVDDIAVKTSCRELDYQITKGGQQTEKGKTEACRTPDGHWLTNA